MHNDAPEARLQKTFRFRDISSDLFEKLDCLHFGIVGTGEEPARKERAESMEISFSFSLFGGAEFRPNRHVEQLKAGELVHFLGRSTVG